MNYPDEDFGHCPKCKSDETITSKGQLKRVCLSCGFSEEFQSYEKAVVGWQQARGSVYVGIAKSPVRTPKTKKPVRQIMKLIEAVEPRVTKVTVPKEHREEFASYLTSRNVQQSKLPKTDVWNNIESAYTEFELSVTYQVAGQIFDDWLAT